MRDKVNNTGEFHRGFILKDETYLQKRVGFFFAKDLRENKNTKKEFSTQ